MSSLHTDEGLLRAAFAPARQIEPSEAEVARVLARLESGTPRGAGRPRQEASWRRLALSTIAALALLFAGFYAVPGTRAAIENATNGVAASFSAWLGGDSAEAPGVPLKARQEAPFYFQDGSWSRRHVHQPRVIAAAGGYKLFAYIERSGSLGFDLGTGFGLGGYTAHSFHESAIEVLGPGSMLHTDAHGHVPLFGISARAVKSVRLVYGSGPPLEVDGIDGGFVLLVEPGREPHEVVAYDGNAEVLGRKAIGYIDWAHYVR
ncbi:MAG TPA: hypothetical protein VNS60_07490 [Solirubrobacterales bacterium]|nr:hypothetical protein [Solirubrobacterales bacterium]